MILENNFLLLYIMGAFVCYVYLSLNSDIVIDVLSSKLFNNKYVEDNKNSLRVFASLIFPITIIKILLLRSNNKNNFMNIKTILVILGIVVLIGFSVNMAKKCVAYYNTSVEMELEFKRHGEKRLAVIDKMVKSIHQTLQIAEINDSSYYKNVLAITSMRSDNEQLMMKWITENNPNANYGEVSAIYNQVTSIISAERGNLLAAEEAMQRTSYEYEKFHRKFPNSLYLYYRPKSLNYKPISTTENRLINQTGIDDNLDIK